MVKTLHLHAHVTLVTCHMNANMHVGYMQVNLQKNISKFSNLSKNAVIFIYMHTSHWLHVTCMSHDSRHLHPGLDLVFVHEEGV